MEISENLKRIEKEWLYTDNNIILSAVAGSGKSFSLLHLIGLCKSRALLLSFNKSIQEEMQEKLENAKYPQGKAITIHSLGLNAIKQSGKSVRIQKGKKWSLVREFEKTDSLTNHTSKKRFEIGRILADMYDVSRLFLTTDYDKIYFYADSMGKIMKPIDRIFWKQFQKNIADSYKSNSMIIDFIDMLYYPVIHNLEIPAYASYLFVDEAQDLNLLQHRIIQKIISQDYITKWAVAGDANQSIYSFAGAISNSMQDFENNYENVVKLPLDICYRCSKKIIQEANKVYPVMKEFKEEEGIVETITDPKLIKDSSMVVCRNSSGLFYLYFVLLSLNKPSYIEGNDIKLRITTILNPYKYSKVRIALNNLYLELEDLQGNKEKNSFKIFNIENDIKIINILCSYLNCGNENVKIVLDKLEGLFVKKENAIILCTIHKSKGLESNVVYFLNQNLVPSKYAVTREQLKQEKNLRYIAITRAKKELYYLDYLTPQ